MPFLRVIVNRSLLASIDTDGKDMVSVLVSGLLVKECAGDLSVSGGTYGTDDETGHLTWVDQPIEVGQTVRVELLETSVEFGKGRTIKEIYPDYQPGADPVPSRAEAISQLEATPRRRDRFELRLSDQDNQIGTLSSEPEEVGFGLSVIWASNKNDEARVSAHAYSVESMRNNQNGRYVMEGKLRVGNALSCELVA
jgi:hypothetical protein